MLEIQVRPTFDSKRQQGDVELHKNGIRYQSSLRSDHKIDINFSNIKHLFFQPCDSELIAIVHVHLKSPILVGKKKTRDVQFFKEASEAQFDETGNRKRRRGFMDEDEIEMEQEERDRRGQLNRYFKAFADKMSEMVNHHLTLPDLKFDSDSCHSCVGVDSQKEGSKLTFHFVNSDFKESQSGKTVSFNLRRIVWST
jgi:nucleosome binding factor SPN SPT16 subunit